MGTDTVTAEKATLAQLSAQVEESNQQRIAAEANASRQSAKPKAAKKASPHQRIVAFTDSSFANNKDLSSQIGYVIALTDTQNNANIIH